MFKRIFKNYQLFVSYRNNISKLERYFPVKSLKKGKEGSIELDFNNLIYKSKSSPKKGIDIIFKNKNYTLKYGEMISINTDSGVLYLRIIKDWTFNTGHDFRKFFYYSIVAHIAIMAILAFPLLLKANSNKEKEDKKIEERVTALLEKIEEKNPKIEKKIELPKKEVKKIIVQKKEKKTGLLDFSKTKKNTPKKIVRRSHRSSRNTKNRNTKTTNGGGGVTSKNISKSLDFLGGSNNSGKVAVNNTRKNSGARGFGAKGISVKGMSPDSEVLNGGNNYSGQINTTGVRGVKNAKYKGSGSGKGTGYSKTLNNIQGKVSSKTLGGSNRGKVGGSLRRAGSLRITGKGKISQKDIQKAISKKLYRLTYCYEKALLSKPNLSGIIRIQWTITLRRKVRSVKIVKSQIRDKKLYKCLIKEIKKIKFPRPKGGDTTVVYPFKFKPTS